MSLEERINKAKQLTFVAIPNTPAPTVGTWGSEDDFYRIRVTRPAQPFRTSIQVNRRQVKLENILVECNQVDNDCGCQGNSKRTICYHSIGALMFILDNRGQEIEFCRDEFVAQGKVENSEWDRNVNTYHFAEIQAKLSNGTLGGSMLAVIRDKVKVVAHGDMTERINSMRGNEVEEEGID